MRGSSVCGAVAATIAAVVLTTQCAPDDVLSSRERRHLGHIDLADAVHVAAKELFDRKKEPRILPC